MVALQGRDPEAGLYGSGPVQFVISVVRPLLVSGVRREVAELSYLGEFGMGESKRCPHCLVVKPVDEFSYRDRTHTTRAGWCKPCTGAKARICRQRKIEYYRAKNNAWNKRNRARVLGYQLKYRTEGYIIHEPLPSAEIDQAIAEYKRRRDSYAKEAA